MTARLVAVLLVFALCGALGVALAGARGPGVVVAPVDTRVSAPPSAPAAIEPAAIEPAAIEPAAIEPAAIEPAAIEPAFLAHMTADDVARGVYGLAGERGAVALTADQRATIGPLLGEGAALRGRLGELRTTRRAARDAWLRDGAALAAAVGDNARSATRSAP